VGFEMFKVKAGMEFYEMSLYIYFPCLGDTS